MQGGDWQQDVVRSRSPIKWSTPQPRMDTVKDTTNPGLRDGEKNTRMLGPLLQDRLKDVKTRSYMRFRSQSRRQENLTAFHTEA